MLYASFCRVTCFVRLGAYLHNGSAPSGTWGMDCRASLWGGVEMIDICLVALKSVTLDESPDRAAAGRLCMLYMRF